MEYHQMLKLLGEKLGLCPLGKTMLKIARKDKHVCSSLVALYGDNIFTAVKEKSDHTKIVKQWTPVSTTSLDIHPRAKVWYSMLQRPGKYKLPCSDFIGIRIYQSKAVRPYFTTGPHQNRGNSEASVGIRMVAKAVCYQQAVWSSSLQEHDSVLNNGRDWYSVPLPSKA